MPGAALCLQKRPAVCVYSVCMLNVSCDFFCCKGAVSPNCFRRTDQADLVQNKMSQSCNEHAANLFSFNPPLSFSESRLGTALLTSFCIISANFTSLSLLKVFLVLGLF